MNSIQAIRAFRYVMEVGSVAAASNRIGRTQSQVSRLISQLEDELGFELFIHERKRLLPTQRGLQFYEEAKRTLENIDALKSYGEMLRQERYAYLRVLAPPYAAYTIIPEAIIRFREAYPEGQFSLEMVTRSGMGAWVSFNQFDIGIASLPFDAPSIEITPLAQLPTVVAMPVDHPLTAKEVVSLEDLAAYPMVALNKFTLIRRQLDHLLQQHGVRLKIVGETDTGLAACALVGLGAGLAIVDRLWLEATPQDRVTWRPWHPGKMSEFGLIRPAGFPMSEPAKLMASILSDIFATRFVSAAPRWDAAKLGPAGPCRLSSQGTSRVARRHSKPREHLVRSAAG